MPAKFNYKAKDKEGKNRAGIVEAANQDQAVRALQDNGLLVMSLSEKREFGFGSLTSAFEKVTDRDVAQFTRLLATMLSTGLPLTEALNDLSNQTENGTFHTIIKSITQDVQSGSTISTAISRYPGVFNSLYINLVKAGETSGKIDEALGKLADTLESQLEFKAKIKGALLYPAIIVVAMTGIGILMVTTVIPKISEVYKEFGAELPLPTKVMLGIADFLINYTIIAVAIVVFFVILYRMLRKNQASDFVISNILLKIPIFGPLSAEAELAIMNRVLATLVGAGVGILDALKVTAGTVGNNFYRQGIMDTIANIQKGMPLSVSFKSITDFPVMESQLVAIGEETGTLDQSLMRLAMFFQDSAERKVKTLTTALEPVLILLMGGAVGGLAIAVLLPMFNLVNVIK